MILPFNNIYFIVLTLIFYSIEKMTIINAAKRNRHRIRKHWNFRSDQRSTEERIKEISPKNCGLKLTTNSYIIGGEEAVRNEFPFIISIRSDSDWGSTHMCGGTIITDRWVLTAAHCADAWLVMDSFGIIAGAHEYSTGEKYLITKVIRHKKFTSYGKDSDGNGGWVSFDIALLKTDRKIRFNANVNAICLPSVPESDPSGVMTVAGWGLVRFHKGMPGKDVVNSEVLRKDKLTIISDQTCANSYAKEHIEVIRSFLCAKQIGKSACTGDSGGPSFQYVNGRAVIVGIVSWSEDDYCAPGEVNVFMQVSYFLDWILEHIDS